MEDKTLTDRIRVKVEELNVLIGNAREAGIEIFLSAKSAAFQRKDEQVNLPSSPVLLIPRMRKVVEY